MVYKKPANPKELYPGKKNDKSDKEQRNGGASARGPGKNKKYVYVPMM